MIDDDGLPPIPGQIRSPETLAVIAASTAPEPEDRSFDEITEVPDDGLPPVTPGKKIFGFGPTKEQQEARRYAEWHNEVFDSFGLVASILGAAEAFLDEAADWRPVPAGTDMMGYLLTIAPKGLWYDRWDRVAAVREAGGRVYFVVRRGDAEVRTVRPEVWLLERLGEPEPMRPPSAAMVERVAAELLAIKEKDEKAHAAAALDRARERERKYVAAKK